MNTQGTAKSSRESCLMAMSFALLALLAASATSVAQNAAVRPAVSDLALSPNGRYLATTRIVDGRTAVVVSDIESVVPALIQPVDYRINWLRWADDHRLLVSVRLHRTGFRYYPRRLLLVDVLKRSSEPVVPDPSLRGGRSLPPGSTNLVPGGSAYQDRVVGVLTDGGTQLLLSYRSSRGRYTLTGLDLDTSNMSIVQEGLSGTNWWLADQSGAARISISWIGPAERILVRAAESNEFALASSHPDEKAPVFAPLLFDDEDPDVLYVVSDHVGETLGLYRWRTSTAAFDANPVTSLRPGLHRIVFNPQRTAIYGVRYVSLEAQTDWIDPHHADIVAQIEQALPGRTIAVVSVSDGLESVAILATGSADPGTYYVYKHRARRLMQLWSAYPDWDRRPIATVEHVVIESPEDQAMSAYVSLPPDISGVRRTPRAGVVLMHGGPYSDDYYAFNPLVQLLAEDGYAVLQLAPNGRRRFARGNANRQEWEIPPSTAGVLSATQWLIDRHLAGTGRVCVVGSNYGGYAALMAALDAGNTYACVATINAPVDVASLGRLGGHPFLPRRPPHAVSPINRVGDFEAPLLLMHGAENTRVPVGRTRVLRKRLESAGKPLVYVELEGEDHEIAGLAMQQRYVESLRGFLAEHLTIQ